MQNYLNFIGFPNMRLIWHNHKMSIWIKINSHMVDPNSFGFL